MYKKILLPTDGSKFAKRALKHAVFIASKSGAEIIALDVVDTNHYVGLPVEESVYHLNEILKEEAQKNLKEIEDSAEEVKIIPKIVEDSPANEILNVAEDEDISIIIMGSSGKTGFERFLLGSVADKVVKNAKCPVLIVH